MVDDEELEKMKILDMEQHKQVLADYLKVDPKAITVCSARINDIATLQARKFLYLVGTEEEVTAGIRSYFEHNLGELDSAFIGRSANLSAGDAQLVDRLCEILDEEIETEILNEALLGVVKRCGDLKNLIDAVVSDVDRGAFLSMDGRENAFGKYFIYKFREGQCSDL